MTAPRPLLRLREPVGGWRSPWPQAFEVARTLRAGSWTLVGGLMVQMHAFLAALPPTRPTTDVDAVLHLETGVTSYSAAAASLRAIGYELDETPQHAYRFRRGAAIVDLMVADHLAPSRRPRVNGRDVLAVEGGTQALRRTVDVDVEFQHTTVRISLPDLHGALVLKAAALMVDSRDPGRHAADAVVLLACLDNTQQVLAALAGSDARRLRFLLQELAGADAWTEVHRDVEALARQSFEELSETLLT